MLTRNRSIQLLLASQSPRRKAILRFAQIPFKAFKPRGVPEIPKSHESASAYASRLALEKARSIARRHPGHWVLGADTIVVLNGGIIEKPVNRVDARRILTSLQGRGHEVMTATVLVSPGALKIFHHLEKTRVRFGSVPVKELNRYLRTSEPYDKAGAYDVRGAAKRWIEDWEGDYFNILGLPLGWVRAQLRRFKR